jgi:hypothetical protein
MQHDWTILADAMCELLHEAYVKNPHTVRRAATVRGISKESLVAAALCELVQTTVNQAAPRMEVDG